MSQKGNGGHLTESCEGLGRPESLMELMDYAGIMQGKVHSRSNR